MGKVMAVCTSPEKGTQKENVHMAEVIEDFGIKDDAHAGKWHRQISLLSYEKIEEFRQRGAEVEFGAFGENIVVRYHSRDFQEGFKVFTFQKRKSSPDIVSTAIFSGRSTPNQAETQISVVEIPEDIGRIHSQFIEQ